MDVVATGSWSELVDAPGTVEEGGSLAWDGDDYIFALRGDRSTDFWRYSIASGVWEQLSDAPDKVDDGGALVFLDGDLYTLRGDDKDDFWRYR